MFAVTFSFVMIIFLWGIILGIYHEVSFDFHYMIIRIVLTVVSTYLLSLFVMTITFMTRNTVGGIIISVIVFMGQMYMPATVVKYVNYIIPYNYIRKQSYISSNNYIEK